MNKPYTKEEYETLLPRIIDHMVKTKEWGEFFPVSVSPFAYNETVAQEYFPLSESEILDREWRWRAEEAPDFSGVTRRVSAERLPDSVREVPDDILNWALVCVSSKRLYRIQAKELELYRKMNLPIPRIHPDFRHERRMAQRNPRKFWTRPCAKCQKSIQTTYPLDRPEIVYCEECYLKEVY